MKFSKKYILKRKERKASWSAKPVTGETPNNPSAVSLEPDLQLRL